VPLGVFAKKIESEIHVWISQASVWNSIPKRIHFMHNTKESIQNNILKLKNNNPKSVFISSSLNEDDYLLSVLRAHNYTVTAESLIDFSAIDFQFTTYPNWLFFSSKNGVQYFFNQVKNIDKSIRLAAINQGTAQALYQLGHTPSFIGEGSNLQQTAAHFDTIANGKIIFPQAKKSMQSIQKNLLKNKDVESIIVYENKPKKNIQKRKETILVFTSPMSAESYLSIHNLDSNQIILSIGKTTTKKITELGISNVLTAYEPTHHSIVDLIFSI